MASSDFDRRAAFEQIGAGKGMPVVFNNDDVTVSASPTFHIDLNIVNQVISDAIIAVDDLITSGGGKSASTLKKIKERLLDLLDNGSDYEKITFSVSRGRYIFPKDVGILTESAHASSNKMSASFAMSCETICNFVCNCLCDNTGNCEQFCENVCHDICTIDDADPSQ